MALEVLFDGYLVWRFGDLKQHLYAHSEVEGTWVVNDITDVCCRRGRVLLRLRVKSDAKLHPVELRRSN